MEATTDKPQVIPQGTQPIIVGIPTGFTRGSSKFGISWKINIDGQGVYYYNSAVIDEEYSKELLQKMMPLGKKCAFSYKLNKSGYKVIDSIYYTF